jgi:hypothetical protein
MSSIILNRAKEFSFALAEEIIDQNNINNKEEIRKIYDECDDAVIKLMDDHKIKY